MTLAEALPGPWVIPEEDSYLPFLRFNDLAAVEVRELPAGLLSGRLSSDRTLRAVAEFYSSFALASAHFEKMWSLTPRAESAKRTRPD